MKISDLMQAMADAGAPMEAILIAVRAIEDGNAALDAKRSVERERKRRQRAKVSNMGASVTGLSRDKDGTVPSTPSLSRPLPPQTPLTPTHTHPEYNTRARKGPVPAKPEGVSSQTWADFLALRKQKRADLSQTALAGIEREAVKAGWSLESALAECVARGWQAFKADWVEGKGAGPPGNSGSLVSGFLTTRKSQTA